MSETYTNSDSAVELDSKGALEELKEIIKAKPAPGALTCKRCTSHIWKLKLSPGSDFFVLECRNCHFEQFVEFCDGGSNDE